VAPSGVFTLVSVFMSMSMSRVGMGKAGRAGEGVNVGVLGLRGESI